MQRDGFFQESLRANAGGLACGFQTGVAAHHEHGHGQQAGGAPFLEQGDAIGVGHPDVEQNKIGLRGQASGARLGCVFSEFDGVAFVVEDFGKKLADAQLIVNYQYVCHKRYVFSLVRQTLLLNDSDTCAPQMTPFSSRLDKSIRASCSSVSPDILGVSAGAGLGAVLAIWLGLPLGAVQGFAFVGGLVAVGAVLGLALLVRRHDPVLVLVLAGVAVGALLGAGIALIKTVADPTTQLPSITFWLMGGLNAITASDLLSTAPALLLGLLPMALLRWRMNLLSLDDDEAEALGVPVARMRMLLVAAATLATAAAVSIAGIIGWVGLVVPHVARLLVGPDFGRLLPASLMLGGGFLVVADTLARTVADIELPLGIVTALVGAPFFLFLLARGGRDL